MSGVYGERPVQVQKLKSSPPVSAGSKGKPKRIVTIDEGNKVVSVIPRLPSKDSAKGLSTDSGVSDVRSGSGGGVRVSARVKTRHHETEETRFYLETEPDNQRSHSHKRKGVLHDAIMRMLGRQVKPDALAEEAMELGESIGKNKFLLLLKI